MPQIENLGQHFHEVVSYLYDNDLDELPQSVFVSDYFIDYKTGRVIRDMEPVEVFIEKYCRNSYGRNAKIFKTGKKGQKLKQEISSTSGSDGWNYSTVKVFNTYEEAKQYYLLKKEEQVENFRNYINTLTRVLNHLES